MTPTELRALLDEHRLPLSFITYLTQLDRGRVARFLEGDDKHLTLEEKNLIRDRVSSRRWPDLQQPLTDGVRAFVQERSVLYIYEKSGSLLSASGSLVRLGDHVFVATTGHSIPKNGTELLEFIGENDAEYSKAATSVPGKYRYTGESKNVVRKWNCHEVLDVGYFEIDSSYLENLGRTAVSRDEIETNIIYYGKSVVVFGYPTVYQRIQRPETKAARHLSPSFLYNELALAPDEWPRVADEVRVPSEDADSFLQYQEDDPRKSVVPATGSSRILKDIPNSIPQPEGMSGGGFWQNPVRIDSDKVWTPSDYKLIAIQSVCDKRQNYIRGIRIANWLQLVARDYPDLRPIIDQSGGRGPDEQ